MINKKYTLNVDIFTCINFRAFLKIGDSMQIYICVYEISALCGIIKVIFMMLIILLIFEKCE